MLTIKSYRNIIGYKYKSGLQLDIFNIAEFDDEYLITVQFNSSVYIILISRYHMDRTRNVIPLSIREKSIVGVNMPTIHSEITIEQLSDVDAFARAIVHPVVEYHCNRTKPTPNV
jgi:hypothetical protein